MKLNQVKDTLTKQRNLGNYLDKKFLVVDKDFNEDDNFNSSLRVGHVILWILVLFIAVMLFWAHFAELEEVTRASGQVISSKKNQLIQSLEGGIIKNILVKEGQTVAKNQVLLKLDNVRFSSDVKGGAIQEAALKLKVLRLTAELKNKPFVVDENLEKQYPSLVVDAKALYNSRQEEIKNLEKMRFLLEKELGITKPLRRHGAVSEVEILRIEQKLSEVKSGINKFRTQAVRELNEARSAGSRITENNVALKDRLDRTDLRSPVKGIVKQIYLTTIGGVVNPGAPIMEVVPLEDTLLVEGKVRPQDIGFLHVGQKALVKVTAYDFSIYGGLEGKVTYISADTSVDKQGNSFYEIWVRTNQNHLERNHKKLQIIPGMQVSVDVITGHKSILNYLLKPILKTKQQALRER